MKDALSLQCRATGYERAVFREQSLVRMERLCRAAVANFSLDLAGVQVLTEAATGPFTVTPVIAALAGAESVIAVARDSSWGSATSAIDQVRLLADRCGILEKIRFQTGSVAAAAQGCHLVTNLGFVRPIDESLVRALAQNAVVALMWEPWEFRAADMDVIALQRNQVVLIGTNEQHPLVRTMDYLGPSVGRLLLEAGIEIVGSTLIVAGSDPFGSSVRDWLAAAGATVVGLTDFLLSGSELVDAFVYVEHRDRTDIFALEGNNALLDTLRRAGAPVVRICGTLDVAQCEHAGVAVIPSGETRPGMMSVTTAYCGPRPVIDLHAAGLRAAVDVIRAREGGANVVSAIEAAEAAGFGLACDIGVEY